MCPSRPVCRVKGRRRPTDEGAAVSLAVRRHDHLPLSLRPLTTGLALLVAVMQVLAYTRKDETWERLARFFGTLFLINFAMGVVTGIVQEFQFGMSWSNYSVFVG